MPKHPDAVGYVNDLAKEVNEQWFRMVCDLAAVSGVSALDQQMIDTLFALYTVKASYIGIKPAAAVAAAAVAAVPADSLEQLAGFTNFKLLGDALDVSLKKRVTLIFGANGSGKSSLCESLKVLATPGVPSRPLENVRVAGAVTPTFRFKFKSDAIPQTWTPAAGYGPRRATVKYFDTAIALQNVTNAVEPGRVIIVAPFKLHIFEWAKALTTKFREALQRSQLDNAAKLTQALQAIRTDFVKFKARPLALIDDKTVSTLAAQIKLGEEFNDQELLREKRAAAAELEKATSEEGLKLLRAEHRELETLLTALDSLLTSAAALWGLDPANKAKTLANKQAAQEVLAKALIPEGSTLDSLLTLLRAASPMCKMDEATDHACPLCKRGLGASEVELFKQYHGLLVGELEKDISAIKVDLIKARDLSAAVGQIDRKAWDKCKTIADEILTAAKTGAELIVASCDISKEPTADAKAALESLKTSAVTWAAQMESKKTAIDAAAKGREELVKQLAKLRIELEPLEYAQAIADAMEKLRETQRMVNSAQFWKEKLPAFTQVLKRITETAKDAHEDLVVTDFEARLDAEYRALAEKGMAAFGVKLARKGADASVTVLPQVGGKGIDGVLSEGEQRLHALALFFAELETCPQSVLVFDDPISSFDYNYIANYCARLRDFTVKHPARQIVVLTHNWEFFVQLQATMNQAGLDGHLSVHVLENCTVVADYSEKIDELKNDISTVLATAGEPSKPKKEELAGKMRRLIEAVVNTHVFNHQRHQYKQKSQAITAFQSFTKVVPLLPAEATTLRDLYAKLSITEHDDPRNAYVNTDKAMFQTRYNQILGIEAAIIGRIPP
ncbi:MAG TPA: AAA family ATPase [Verrucomicrobiae bacterium]|nr:AAA family ATPase [Verrucomicrobiae bacterium]